MNKLDLSLYLVTDRTLSLGRSHLEIIQEAVKGGATMIQLREKELDSRRFYEEALRIKAFLKPLNIPLIINDRLDIALAIDADGLHIGQKDMPYAVARKWLGPHKIIGLSVETIEEAQEANSLDVDYIGISPVFSTTTKTDINTPLGLEGIRQIASFTSHPMVGIGGIHLENATSVIQAGADGIAVISAIVAQPNVEQAARTLKSVVQNTKNHV